MALIQRPTATTNASRKGVGTSTIRSSRNGTAAFPWSRVLALCVVTGFVGFYAGVLCGIHVAGPCPTNVTSAETDSAASNPVSDTFSKTLERLRKTAERSKRFSAGTSRFVQGMARTPRDDFAKQFDMGVPVDKSQRGNEEVLILYNDKAKPNERVASADGGAPPLLEVQEATKNCDNLHVILTDYNPKRRQCIGIMGQYEAFHIQKFMRLPEQVKKPIDPNLPLRLVNRGSQQGGGKSTNPPTRELTLQYWKTLQNYLANLDSVLERLKPLAAKVAVKNTVIVMVCNFGQSELLLNFACSARAKGLDTSHVLVFATDEETKELAEGIGLTAFYDETNFKSMPSRAARAYLDRNFAAMMMAKVYCVQMITMLGYDVLFQDVDVVWYRDPLEYFHDPSGPYYNFEIYFQDDGNHGLYYAPYSANTGMYYIRHNDRTQYFMNSFLLAGDLVLSTKSHQIALIALLNEHASMYGLKVKVMSREEDEFPGGFHYHRKKPYMKDLIAKKVHPYIFHMSWTKNKDNKLLFMRQMGMWYLQDTCVAKQAKDISKTNPNLVESCCLKEPKISCHYSDKPSAIPCRDSPPIDAGRRSWW